MLTKAVPLQLTPTEVNQQVTNLQAYINKLPGATEGNKTELTKLDSLPTAHYHCNGAYVREVFMKAGSIIIGKVHLHAHLNIVSLGKALVASSDGVVEISAPCTFQSSAGVQRALYILEDMVWSCIFSTEELDVDVYEAQNTRKDRASYDLGLEV